MAEVTAKRFFAYIALEEDLGYIGFALVAPAVVTRSDGAWMEQFFVFKRHRGSGTGRELARFLFARHPGPWEVGQMKTNLTAQAFWRNVVADFTNGQYNELHVTEGPWQGVVQQFTAPNAV